MPVIERVLDSLSNLKQYVQCVDERSVRNPRTKSFEMVKSACQANVCWCCKLLYAFSAEICSSTDQGMFCD